MKKIFFTLFGIFIAGNSFAAGAENSGILGGAGKTQQDIREGNIHISDFPNMIRFIIDILLGLAGTIALVFIIIGAYQVAFGALSDNKTQGKETIIMALGGFVLAAMAWIIIKFVLQNLGA